MSDELHNPNGNGNGYRRGDNGYFAPGTKPGPGRPSNASTSARLRQKLLGEIKDEDIRDAIEALRKIIKDDASKPNDRIAAIKELLDRSVGKPIGADIEAELDELRQELSQLIGAQK